MRITTRLALLGLAVLAAVSPLTAQHGSPRSAVDLRGASVALNGITRQIDSVVAELRRREQVPGLTVAVAVGGKVILERGYGIADLENGVPASAATEYRIASITKLITATSVMQLVEKGTLDLDAPIQRYVPEYREKTFPVTVRALLGHTSGVRGYRGSEYTSSQDYPTIASSLAIFESDSLEHAPGARFTYTPYGYTLLGLAVERASGTPYMSYLRQHVFTPAGMVATVEDRPRAIVPHRARGSARDSSGSVINAQFVNTSNKVAGGGLLSTAGDMAHFGSALLDGRMITPASFAQMRTPIRTTDGKELPLGWSVVLGSAGGQQKIGDDAVWMSGMQQGTTGVVHMLPRERVVVVILTNLEQLLATVPNTADVISRIVLRSTQSANP